MYIAGDKYLSPKLQRRAAEEFHSKLEWLCESETYWEWDTKERILEAIEIIYEELSDTDWLRYYFVQTVFKHRSIFLPHEWFRDSLKDRPAFSEDFINELAWDSKIWEWRKACREWDSRVRKSEWGINREFPT